MGIYVFSRDVLLELLAQEPAHDFGREMIPAALTRYKRAGLSRTAATGPTSAPSSSFYEANIMLTRADAPFSFYDPTSPDLHARALPAAVASWCDCSSTARDRGRRVLSRTMRRSTDRSSASARTIGAGTPDRRVRCCSAPTTTSRRGPSATRCRLGIGRDVVLNRVIVDKNARIGDGARLINSAGVEHADGDGYYIRNGIIIVPKDGTIAPGTVV